MHYVHKIVLVLIFSLGGLGLASAARAVQFTGTPTIAVAPYDTVVAQGRIHITLVRSSFASGIQVLGSQKEAEHLKVEQRGGTILLSKTGMFSSNSGQFIDVVLPVANLQTFTVTLRGMSQMLMGPVKMSTFNIRTLDAAHAQVNVSTWLNAIALDNSSIYFTGRPKHVNAQSYDASTVIPLIPAPYC